MMSGREERSRLHPRADRTKVQGQQKAYVKHDECQDWGQVQGASDGRDDAPEEVQVRVAQRAAERQSTSQPKRSMGGLRL